MYGYSEDEVAHEATDVGSQTSPDDETMDESQSEDDDVLHSVKLFQSDHNRNTCLIHQNPEEHIVENFTKTVLNKKKKFDSAKTFTIAPGEGIIYSHTKYTTRNGMFHLKLFDISIG